MFPDVDLATEVKVLGTHALMDRVIAKLSTPIPTLQIQPPQDRLASWRKALHLPASAVPARRQAIEMTAGTFVVKAIRTSRVIEIQCDSTDPNLAAAFANTMASEYIEQSIEIKVEGGAAHRRSGSRVSSTKSKPRSKNRKISCRAMRHPSTWFFRETKTAATYRRNGSAKSRRNSLMTLAAGRSGNFMTAGSLLRLAVSGLPPDALGQVVDDATLRVIDSKLVDLRREQAELTATLGPAHDRVRKVRAQIAEMEADQKKSRERIVDRISNDFREAERREKLLQAAYQAQSGILSEQASKITHYNILKREVETNRQLYDSLLQKVKEASISAALRASNIQVIDAAKAPRGPFAPDMKQGASLGMLFGLFGGIGLVMVQEKLKRCVETPGEAAVYLDTPELGVIPSWSIDRAADRQGRKRFLATGYRKENGGAPVSVFQRSESLAAEAFRVILTSLLYIGRKRPSQVLVVGSPGASEGKTTVIANMALGFAETNRSVLLIDCDMRRPRLHELFDVSNETGLADLLSRKEPLQARDLIRAVCSFEVRGRERPDERQAGDGSGKSASLHATGRVDCARERTVRRGSDRHTAHAASGRRPHCGLACRWRAVGDSFEPDTARFGNRCEAPPCGRRYPPLRIRAERLESQGGRLLRIRELRPLLLFVLFEGHSVETAVSAGMRNSTIVAPITLVVLYACFEYGGVTPREWGYCLMAIVGCSLALWLPVRAGQSAPPLHTALLSGLILAVLAVGAQLVPLRLEWLRVIDPARAELLAGLNRAGVGSSDWAPTSVAPSLTFAHLQRLLSYILMFFMARELSWRMPARKWLLAIPVITAGTLEAVLGLAQYFGGAARATGTYVNPNHFAALLHMALPLTVMLAAEYVKRSLALACLFMTCSAVILAGALYSLSRMSFVTVLACGGILALLGWRRHRMWSAGARADTGYSDRVCPARNGAERSWWIASLSKTDRPVTPELRSQFREGSRCDLIVAYPVFGCRIGRLWLGDTQKFRDSAPSLVDFAHNDYLQIFAETGLVGAIPLFFCAAWLFVTPWRVALAGSRSKYRLLAVACAASLSAAALDSTVDFDFYVPANMLVAAWIAGLSLPNRVRVGDKPSNRS